MSARVCQSCAAQLGENARFCPQCGKRVEQSRALKAAAKAYAAGVVLLELVAMGSMGFYAIPTVTKHFFAYGGHRSAFASVVLAPWWMPSFMVAVAILGVVAIFVIKSIPIRTLVVILALVIGVLPMVASYAGIEVTELQVAENAAGE